MKSKVIIPVFILFFAFNFKALAEQFTATLSQNPISQGERVQLTFAVDADGKNFRPPAFKGVTVLSGPSQSSSFSFVNGRSSHSLSFTYVIQADQKGEITIDPATIQVGNNTLKTNSIKLKVLEPSAAQKQQKADQAKQEKSLNEQANDLIKKNMFIRTSASKTSAYLGEQIVVTYKLYKNRELQNVSIQQSKMPSFNGFWSQDFEEKQVNWVLEKVDGVLYETAVVKKVVLFPQQTGKLNIDPIEFNTVVRLRTSGGRRSNDPWDNFFNQGGYQDFPYLVKSPTIPISVLALPPNPPTSFKGAVGKLQMEAWLDKTKTVTGDPVTLKVKISGDGNLKLIDALNLTFPPGMESYDPKIADNIIVSLSGTSGSKVFEYLLLPRNPGNYKIGPLAFSYFDLAKKQYVTLNSKEFNLEVGKGSGTNEYSGNSGTYKKEELQYLGKDILYIKTQNSSYGEKSQFFGKPIFFIAYLLPISMFLGFLFYKRKNDELHADKALYRNKKATKLAQKRLTLAKIHKDKNEKEKFFEEISKSLWGYISDKLSIPYSDLNKDKAKEELTKLKISEEFIGKLFLTIEDCEFARYAPGQASGTMDDIYNDTALLLSSIESELKK